MHSNKGDTSSILVETNGMTPDERIALLEHDLLQLRENEIKLKSKIEEQAAELAELHVALRQAAPQTSPRESEAEVFHDASDSNLSDSGAPTLPPIRDISFRSFAKEVKFMQKSMNALEATRVVSKFFFGVKVELQYCVLAFGIRRRTVAPFAVGVVQVVTSVDLGSQETSRRVKSLVEGGDSMYLVESSAAGSTKSSVLQAACTPFARCCGAEASTHLTVLNGGQLYYNDTPAEDAAHMSHRFVSFIRQNEEHIACLTVRETLKFAHLCQLGRDMSFWKSMHEDVSDSEELQSLLTTRH
eukprot:gene28233-34964_t